MFHSKSAEKIKKREGDRESMDLSTTGSEGDQSPPDFGVGGTIM